MEGGGVRQGEVGGEGRREGEVDTDSYSTDTECMMI